MGSKNRISKHILPFILANRSVDQYYVEPFVGGANLIDKIKGNRIGNDINRYVIALLKAVQDGIKLPTEVSEDLYYSVKHSPNNYPDYLVGFIGICCSYSGKMWGGYARGNTPKNIPRNYADEQVRHLNNQRKHLIGIDFRWGSYTELVIPPNSLLYCDPPYRATTKYSTSQLDYSAFYDWCRLQKYKGHTIYISEYYMPEDFTCVWKGTLTSSLTQDTGSKKALERLYTL